jgi:hypothetical protein
MTKDEALKLALEALESTLSDNQPYIVKCGKAITAIKEALAQPEQEPSCPECKAAVLYECVACSSNNYPPLPVQPEHEMRHWEEEYECAVKCLDECLDAAGVPKADSEGTSYSLWGRINCYATLSLPAQPPLPPLPVQPMTGKGKEYSEQLKLCARNVAFVAAGRVDMSSAAMQEMFALIDHVCAGIDSPPLPVQEPTDKQIEDAIDAWFSTSGKSWEERMRAAFATASLPVQPEDRNFCPRCGKRRGGDVNYIHTCTPPIAANL